MITILLNISILYKIFFIYLCPYHCCETYNCNDVKNILINSQNNGNFYIYQIWNLFVTVEQEIIENFLNLKKEFIFYDPEEVKQNLINRITNFNGNYIKSGILYCCGIISNCKITELRCFNLTILNFQIDCIVLGIGQLSFSIKIKLLTDVNKDQNILKLFIEEKLIFEFDYALILYNEHIKHNFLCFCNFNSIFSEIFPVLKENVFYNDYFFENVVLLIFNFSLMQFCNNELQNDKIINTNLIKLSFDSENIKNIKILTFNYKMNMIYINDIQEIKDDVKIFLEKENIVENLHKISKNLLSLIKKKILNINVENFYKCQIIYKQIGDEIIGKYNFFISNYTYLIIKNGMTVIDTKRFSLNVEIKNLISPYNYILYCGYAHYRFSISYKSSCSSTNFYNFLEVFRHFEHNLIKFYCGIHLKKICEDRKFLSCEEFFLTIDQSLLLNYNLSIILIKDMYYFALYYESDKNIIFCEKNKKIDEIICLIPEYSKFKTVIINFNDNICNFYNIINFTNTIKAKKYLFFGNFDKAMTFIIFYAENYSVNTKIFINGIDENGNIMLEEN